MQGGSVMRHFRHMLNMLRAKKTPATAKPPPDPLHILLDEKNDRADVTLAALSGLVDIHNAAMKEMMGIYREQTADLRTQVDFFEREYDRAVRQQAEQAAELALMTADLKKAKIRAASTNTQIVRLSARGRERDRLMAADSKQEQERCIAAVTLYKNSAKHMLALANTMIRRPWLANDECVTVEGATLTRRDCLVRAVNLDPTLFEAWFCLGLDLSASEEIILGDASETKYSQCLCFNQCLEINNSSAMAWNNAGAALLKKSGLKASLEVNGQKYSVRGLLLRALELDPTNSCAWFNLALTFERVDERIAVNNARHGKTDCLLLSGLDRSLIGERLKLSKPILSEWPLTRASLSVCEWELPSDVSCLRRHRTR